MNKLNVVFVVLWVIAVQGCGGSDSGRVVDVSLGSDGGGMGASGSSHREAPTSGTEATNRAIPADVRSVIRQMPQMTDHWYNCTELECGELVLGCNGDDGCVGLLNCYEMNRDRDECVLEYVGKTDYWYCQRKYQDTEIFRDHCLAVGSETYRKASELLRCVSICGLRYVR